MKILILGYKGTLGQELKKSFEKEELVCFDKDNLDLTDHKKTKEKIKDISPDVIINASAHTNVDAAENEEKELAFQINSYAVENLAKSAKSIDAILIHFSTDYIFDGTTKGGYKEDAAPNPINIYGESKLLGEKLILENTKKYYIIRLSRLFGEMGVSKQSKKSFVDLMLDLASKKDELKITNDAVSNVTYAPDLAKATYILVKEKYPFGIYHLTNEGSCTFYEFAEKIFEIKNINIKITPVNSDEFPRPAKIPTHSSLVNTKFPKLRHWEDALKEYLSKK